MTGAVNVTSAAIGVLDGAPVVFAAAYLEARDLTQILLVSPSTSLASVVAELSGQSEEDSAETGRTAALLWDGASLWAAGGYGVARLRPPGA